MHALVLLYMNIGIPRSTIAHWHVQLVLYYHRRRAWGRPAPTELERGTRDGPIVLDPPGKFQCIVEAASRRKRR